MTVVAGVRTDARGFIVVSRAAVSYSPQGTIKLIAEAGTDRLHGAHVVAGNAGDIISEAVLAVRFGLTTRDIVSTLHHISPG